MLFIVWVFDDSRSDTFGAEDVSEVLDLFSEEMALAKLH